GEQQRREHADAVTDGRAYERRSRAARLHGRQLLYLEDDRAVRVDDALRVRRRAARVRDQGGARRVDFCRRPNRLGAQQVRELDVLAVAARVLAVVVDDGNQLEVGKVGAQSLEVGEVVEVAEARR